MRSRTWLPFAGVTLVAGLLIAGCGASKGSDVATSAATTSQSTTTSSGGSQNTLTVKMSDYSFTPSAPTVKAGPVTISAPNDGQIQHELVVFKTDKSAGSLPTKGAEVDEDGLEASGATNEGEIQDVAAGETKSTDFKLAPGKYVMICNVPGHYAQGMYGTITVK
jgi:uncharacterized cupredoxin-like copper-binding protein